MSSSALWQMFQPQRASTDAELAGNMLRMVALWPLVREDMGMSKVEQAMKILQASGMEPGSEAYAQAHEQQIGPLVERYNLGRRGIPGRIPFTRLVGGEEFQQKFPEQYSRMAQQIDAVTEPFLVNASPETRERIKKAVMAQVASGQLPARQMPDGTLQLDAAAAYRSLQGMIPNVIQLAGALPQATVFGKYLAANNPDLLKMAESNPLLRIWISMPVDEREPHKVMQAFVADLRNNASSLLQSAELAVKMVSVDPSPSSLAKATSVINGLEQAVNLGAIPRQAVQALLATAQAYRNQSMRVVMPDGTETFMNGLQAQQVINERTKFLIETQAAPLAAALAHNPIDPALQKRKQALLAQALKEGIPLEPVIEAIYGDKRVALMQARAELAGASQRLANSRQEAVAQGLQIERLRINLGRDQRFAETMDRVVKAGSFAAATPQDRMVMALNGIAGTQGTLRLQDWAAVQKEHSQPYAQATNALISEQDPRRSVILFRSVAASFDNDNTFNQEGMISIETTPAARLSAMRNLDLGRQVLIPQMIRLRKMNLLRPDEVESAIRSYRTALHVATQNGLLRQQDAASYLQALAAAERVQPDAAAPGWWDWLRKNWTGAINPFLPSLNK